MKTLTNLSATPSEGELNARGNITELHYEDPTCGGWFIGISLTAVGLKFRAKRPGGASVAIPLDELLNLARQHAPEVFADDAAISALKKAANDPVLTGGEPLKPK